MSREIEPGCRCVIVGVKEKINADLIGREVTVLRQHSRGSIFWETDIDPFCRSGRWFGGFRETNLIRIDGHDETEDERVEEVGG